MTRHDVAMLFMGGFFSICSVAILYCLTKMGYHLWKWWKWRPAVNLEQRERVRVGSGLSDIDIFEGVARGLYTPEEGARLLYSRAIHPRLVRK